MSRIMRRRRRPHARLAKSVAVRARRPWYFLAALIGIPALLGYALGYWQFSGDCYFQARGTAEQMRLQRDALASQLLLAERQLQIERATRSNLAKEMAALQDEGMRLKEDIAFYKGILDGTPATAPRLHSVRLLKGTRPGEYRYRIYLMQSGRVGGPVRGSLELALQEVRAGKIALTPIGLDGKTLNFPVAFKQYQRMDGTFMLPNGMAKGRSLLVKFVQAGGEPAVTQLVSFPE